MHGGVAGEEQHQPKYIRTGRIGTRLPKHGIWDEIIGRTTLKLIGNCKVQTLHLHGEKEDLAKLARSW